MLVFRSNEILAFSHRFFFYNKLFLSNLTRAPALAVVESRTVLGALGDHYSLLLGTSC